MMNKDPLDSRLQRYLAERDEQRPPLAMEERILRAVKGERVPAARRSSFPRQLLAATAVAVFGISLAFGVALRNHVFVGNSGPSAQRNSPIQALSIGTDGGGNWVVGRGVNAGPVPTRTTNILYQTTDGGQTWQDRLHFIGIYDGMSWSSDGRIGMVWTFEMSTPCGPTARTCNIAPTQVTSFFSTTDGGIHWTQRPSKVFGDFNLVYFRGTTGWVLSEAQLIGQSTAGTAQLYRTDDLAATWNLVGQVDSNGLMGLSGGVWGHTSGVGETNLEFLTVQHGWLATGVVATSTGSGLLETTDGGRTWKSVIVVPPSSVAGKEMVLGYPVLLGAGKALLPVFFGHHADINNYVADQHYIYSSSDGGATWSNPRPLQANGIEPTGNQWQNFYLDANHWWFTTTNQRTSGEPVPQAGPGVARTTDGGKTWQLFSTKDSPIIEQMTFTDQQNGWAFAIAGPSDTTNVLLRTTDGGAYWRQIQVP